MRRALRSATLLGLAVGAAFGAGQARADNYKFMLVNNSQYAINGFETFENNKWSSWTGVKVGPGESIQMDWQSSAGYCTVPFRILYRDIQTEQYSVNWCNIRNIRVSDTDVTAD